MGIQTQIDRLSTNIADAYAALAELGAAMPSVKNSDNLAATIASILPGSENAFIKFSCASSMNITSSAIFDGSLEASEDGGPWKAWTGGSYLFGKQICIRGTGNTKMSGAWALGSAYNNKIFCTGNIEALLDYETVEAGGHPTMASGCYRYMFKNCTLLASAPALPATTLADNCYEYMFQGCTSLVSAPALPATTLANYCYEYMFQGCTSLVSAPALPATTLADNCYEYMFQGCTSLTSAPQILPATTLLASCYYGMFSGCTSLVSAPALPATTLANYCYSQMFYGCTSLVSAPALPATTLLASCYARMFYGCSQIKLSATQDETYTKPYRIPTEGTGTSASTALSRMFLDSSNSYFTPLHQHHVLSSVHGDDRQPGRNAVVRGCAA